MWYFFKELIQLFITSFCSKMPIFLTVTGASVGRSVPAKKIWLFSQKAFHFNLG
jgi:hypothetical protein